MENAAFDAMLRWLGLLQQQYRIQVVSMNIDSKDKPGRINARYQPGEVRIHERARPV